ncbi:hypothetical protein [Microbacterium sp. TNHR37B]|uniref:hypothetical protein n=1 Tax=Microbacterium sp. TNHR37B TaxID=1775956 RepID=UPI0007B19BC3|nr:hypothetical protein [Microbacterium sp. TNHR37B]KZE89528.1 hypothetical protein AVP41_02326 [Microbacterium sp. TNHR37B]
MRISPVAVLALLGTLVLSGCSAAEPTLPTESTTPRETANEASSHIAELYAPDALPLSEYVNRYPAYTPAELRGVQFLAEGAATATEEFPLADVALDTTSLILAIFCDADSPYEIAVMRGTDVIDRTWGAQCPRDGIVFYTTASLAIASDGLSVRATVDDGTPYRLSVAAVAPHSP